jgi:mRNA interferase MazF
MTIQRGEIYLADLDPSKGVEQAGMRPVLVVQCDLANQRIPSVTIVPLTSNLKAGRFLFTVPISTQESGLPQDSVILAFQIRTIDKLRLIRKIGTLSAQKMEAVNQALAHHLDCCK